MKKMNRIWGISLMVISIATLIVTGSRIFGLELPDAVIRLIGIVELLALPVLVFTSVRMRQDRKDETK